MNDKLLASVRFYFAQSVFNTNCHFKAIDRLQKKKRNISIFVSCLSGGTLFLLILQIAGLELNYQFLLNIVSIMGLLLTGTSLMFQLIHKDDYIQEIFQHKTYVEKYKSLRDEYMSLIEEIMSDSSSHEQLRKKRDSFQIKNSHIGKTAPSTTNGDYKQAQIGLGLRENKGEEFTWADEEIDRFLPKQLKITV